MQTQLTKKLTCLTLLIMMARLYRKTIY